MAEKSPSKRQKTFHNYNKNKRGKHVLEPGQKGFFATCNFREKDCVRECYNILNEYANNIYGLENDKNKPLAEADGEEDISDQLEKEIAVLKAESKNQKRRFQNVDTGTTNCIFICTTLKDPVDLGMKIIMDISENKMQKSRFLLRLIPVALVCRANVDAITESAGKLFDDFFLKGNLTYSIQFNKRHNNVIDRMEIINCLVGLINDKNPTNKVDLKNANLYVIVEIIKGLCLLSVVPDYLKLKKFNIVELSKQIDEATEKQDVEVSHVTTTVKD